MNDDRYQKNDSNTPLLVFLVILTLAVIAGGIYFASGMVRRSESSSLESMQETELQTDDTQENETEMAQVDSTGATGASDTESVLDVVAVVKKVMPSMVAITNKSVQEVTYMYRGSTEIESESSGSGIIIGKNDTELLIATNYHVIEAASTLTVCFTAEVENEEDAIVAAVIKGSDEAADLAVVAVSLSDIPDEVMEQIDIAELGSSETLVIGEPAIAIGNALGYGQSVTFGIISALNRVIEVDGTTATYIQTDAAINAGNSGGALLNSAGQVIGINSAKVAASGVEGMGYAIPIDVAKPILTQLMSRETREKVEEEERGYLGVLTQDISSEARSLYEIPGGVYVIYVASDSPAADAGIQRGDIISSLDDVSISSSSGFEDLLEYYQAGETVTVEIYRSSMGKYTSMTVSVTFAQQPQAEDNEDATTSPGSGSNPFSGLRP